MHCCFHFCISSFLTDYLVCSSSQSVSIDRSINQSISANSYLSELVSLYLNQFISIYFSQHVSIYLSISQIKIIFLPIDLIDYLTFLIEISYLSHRNLYLINFAHISIYRSICLLHYIIDCGEESRFTNNKEKFKKQNNPKFDEFTITVDIKRFGFNNLLRDFKIIKKMLK